MGFLFSPPQPENEITMTLSFFPMNNTLPRLDARKRAKAHRQTLTNLAIQIWRSERLRREQAVKAVKPVYPSEPEQQYPTRPPR